MKKESKAGKIGKRVKIITHKDKQEFEGTLLYSYDPDIVLLKLSSGYNIGIEKNKIKKIQEIKEKGRVKKKEKEFRPKIKKTKGLPRVAVIVTGGTISSKVDYETGAVKPIEKPEDIIAVAPKIQEIASLEINSPFMAFSENISAKNWQDLAKSIASLLNKKEIKGIIVLCGTDTLHYTASALAFMLQNINKPVILTYAQRSIDRGSSDAFLNLTCSVYAALSDIAEVFIVGHATSNDNFCFALRATKTRKMHTSRRDTFRPINTKPIATINDEGKINIISKYNKRNDKKVKAEPFFEEKTALIKWHPNLDPKIIDFFIKQKYKGIVIEATGFGHVAIEGKYSWFKNLKKAVQAGIVICFAPQTIYGTLDAFVYATGRKLQQTGIIYLHDMLSETAFIKLGWLLGKEKDKKKVKELMLKNIAGEYNPQLSEKDFLV